VGDIVLAIVLYLWEDRWELIGGIAYTRRELDTHMDCNKCEVYIFPIDWKIDYDTIVQPDVAIFCGETTKQYFSQTPPIVVEVLSKSTALKDVTTKYTLYEKMGVEF